MSSVTVAMQSLSVVVEIGGLPIRLHCDNPDFVRQIQERYAGFLSSSSDARSASPASIPGTCEARFRPTPTRNTRSWLSVGRVVFIQRKR